MSLWLVPPARMTHFDAMLTRKIGVIFLKPFPVSLLVNEACLVLLMLLYKVEEGPFG